MSETLREPRTAGRDERRDERTETDRKSRQSLCNWKRMGRPAVLLFPVSSDWSFIPLGGPASQSASAWVSAISSSHQLLHSVSSAADFYFTWDRAQQDRDREETEVHHS
ncbi:hypothetical protein ABVT39_019400 [Epinephelus coioides]